MDEKNLVNISNVFSLKIFFNIPLGIISTIYRYQKCSADNVIVYKSCVGIAAGQKTGEVSIFLTSHLPELAWTGCESILLISKDERLRG